MTDMPVYSRTYARLRIEKRKQRLRKSKMWDVCLARRNLGFAAAAQKMYPDQDIDLIVWTPLRLHTCDTTLKIDRKLNMRWTNLNSQNLYFSYFSYFIFIFGVYFWEIHAFKALRAVIREAIEFTSNLLEIQFEWSCTGKELKLLPSPAHGLHFPELSNFRMPI